MKISIDLDGVLCNFTSNFRNIARRIGLSVPDTDPTDWNWGNWNLTKAQQNEAWKAVRATDDFWTLAPAYGENVTALRRFLYTVEKQEIFFTTSRVATVGDPISIQSERWLVRHGIGQSYANYLVVLPVEHAAGKAKLYDVLGITHSIDDYGPTVLTCEMLDNHKAFLLNRSWNQEYNPIRRVTTLQEFLDSVQADVEKEK